ncbi:DUF4190 domain-containing protein [Streptomyces sp. NPDC002677]|uniref:DUF4190 domain-containing protein n=1 Tax=Streptomyces sp. NPDC002677 TaxID=3154774 RepID=UPI003317CDC2
MADEAPKTPKIRLDKTAEEREGEREGAGAEPSVPPSLHDQRTVAAMPGAEDGVPPQGWAHPFAAPSDAAPAPPVNPFAAPGAPPAPSAYPPPNAYAPPAPSAYAPPAPSAYAPPAPPYPQSAAVPPPPMAPEGPGQVPYGYPGAPAPGPGYGYPGQPFPPYPGGYGGWPGMQPMPNNGLGTASLVTGIISVVGFCAWPAALVMGVLAIVFGSIGRARVGRGEATNGGQALAGIICGSAGLVLAAGFIVLLVVASSQ